MGNFTDTYIRNLKGKDARYEEYEGGGFGIRISPNQLKTWIYRYKINGKTEKITLGHYPNMSLADAKKKFLEFSTLKRTGQTPRSIVQQQQEKKNNTVAKLVEAWYNHYVYPTNNIRRGASGAQIHQQMKIKIPMRTLQYELNKLQKLGFISSQEHARSFIWSLVQK